MFRFVPNLLLSCRVLGSNARFALRIQTLSSLNSTPDQTQQLSLTVSYLKNSCGLSLEKAISASKSVNIVSTEKADSVLELLKGHGFTTSDIAKLISLNPRIILCKPETNLRPKIEYIKSIGIEGPYIPKLLSCMLNFSLKNHIMPNIEYLREVLGSDEKLIILLIRYPYLIRHNTERGIMSKISTLRAHGMPVSNIVNMIMMEQRILTYAVGLFEKVVNEVKEMGFEPRSSSFVLAVKARLGLSRSKWKRKKDLFMSLGWSETQFLWAFRVQPMFMLCSEEKIKKILDFCLNKVGLEPSDFARYPNLFLISLERRIIPRCSVLKVLLSKKLVKKWTNIAAALIIGNKVFEKRFVTEFMEDCPEVVKAYHGKIGFQGFSD